MATISTDADYSAGSYSNNEGFTITQGAKFTIDQSTIDLRNMRCTSFGECLVKNESTTTPIIVSLGSTGGTARWQFTAGGISTIQGEWIVLGTGDGVAGQTFNIPQAQGVNGIGTQDVPDPLMSGFEFPVTDDIVFDVENSKQLPNGDYMYWNANYIVVAREID